MPTPLYQINPRNPDPQIAYEDAVIAKLTAPSPRNAAIDKAAREQRRGRTSELTEQRKQTDRETLMLGEAIDIEKKRLQKLNTKYDDVVLDSDKTDIAVRLRAEMDVLKERISRLETDRTKKQQQLQGLDAELKQIAEVEKAATEDESVAATLAELGGRASTIIDRLVSDHETLREIAIDLHYRLPAGCSAGNSEKLQDLADCIIKSYRIRLHKRMFKHDLAEQAVFLRFLRQEQWP